jgi:4-amino-4-deoxy-L-arabinose transferase-like glycosyltransferase
MFYGKGAHPETELLVLARLGVLPFFVIALVAIWMWTSRYIGRAPAAIAVILLGNLPVFLAHFGLATTDAVFTAAFVAAFFSFLLWLERPTIPRGLALGVAFALAVSAKLSALLFLPAACGAVLAHRWISDGEGWRAREFLIAWRGWLVSFAAFLVTVWVVYGCNGNPLYGVLSLARGVGELAGFAHDGDPSYFLGEIHDHGSWAFFLFCCW